MSGSTLADNRTGLNSGGGLYAISNGDVTISNSLFRDNSAGFLGGGLLASQGTIEIAASRFTGNAGTQGSAGIPREHVLGHREHLRREPVGKAAPWTSTTSRATR